MFVHTVIMVIEPHMKQGRQHKLISTIFLATSVTKKLDHNTSRSQTASASLKNTRVPSTSIKRICWVSSIFSEERPKRFLLPMISCSIIACILVSRECRLALTFSNCSCWFRNIWISIDLSTLFNCSSVYLIAMAGTPFLHEFIVPDFYSFCHLAAVFLSSL